MSFNWPASALTVREKIGIGTDTPSEQLEVKGNIKLNSGVAIGNFSDDGSLNSANNQSVPTSLAVKTYIDSKITPLFSVLATKAESSGSLTQDFQARNLTGQGNLEFTGTTNLTGSLTVTDNVGIGTSTPGQKLEVVGTVRATAFEGNGSALTGVQVPDGSIEAPKLAANAINATHLANGAVSSQKLNADVMRSFLSSGGGTINGDLLVNGNLLGAVRGPSNERFRTVIGFTRSGATNWQVYQANALRLDIDTSSTGFTSVPYYFTSMGGDTKHWLAVGATAIYSPTATGFTVYVRYLDSNITPAQVNEWGWFVRWMAIGSTGI